MIWTLAAIRLLAIVVIVVVNYGIAYAAITLGGGWGIALIVLTIVELLGILYAVLVVRERRYHPSYGRAVVPPPTVGPKGPSGGSDAAEARRRGNASPPPVPPRTIPPVTRWD